MIKEVHNFYMYSWVFSVYSIYVENWRKFTGFLIELLFSGGNPYDGMTGREVFNFVQSGHRMQRNPVISLEL